MKTAAPICAALVLMILPAAAQDMETIQARSNELAEAFNNEDAEAMGAMYTEDARLLPPGTGEIQGREAISGYWKTGMDQLTGLKLTTEAADAMGDGAAREIGSFVISTKGDQPQEISGKYVVIWEKVGDDWLLATDIWNMNQ